MSPGILPRHVMMMRAPQVMNSNMVIQNMVIQEYLRYIRLAGRILRAGPFVAAARCTAAISGPGPGSEHYFFSKVRVLVLSQPKKKVTKRIFNK